MDNFFFLGESLNPRCPFLDTFRDSHCSSASGRATSYNESRAQDGNPFPTGCGCCSDNIGRSLRLLRGSNSISTFATLDRRWFTLDSHSGYTCAIIFSSAIVDSDSSALCFFSNYHAVSPLSRSFSLFLPLFFSLSLCFAIPHPFGLSRKFGERFLAIIR